MRVLYLSDNSSDHNRRFLDKIASFGHDVWFLNLASVCPPSFALAPRVQWLQPSSALERGASPRAAAQFVSEFRALWAAVKPDLVHAGPIQTCGYIAALAGVHPLVITSWGSDLLLLAEQDGEWSHATRITLRAADGFLCDSDAVRDAACHYSKLPQCRIAQFPWGLEKQHMSALTMDSNSSSRKLGAGLTFLCTRSWEPTYDIPVLLSAFQRIHKRDPRHKLLLVGDGSLRGQVRHLISVNNLEQSIVTPGAIQPSDMAGWFKSADAYVSCAQSDGASISLLEAMAVGLPVIVTDIPSNREWVSEGENGWLAARGSPEEFAAKMLKVAEMSESEMHAVAKRNRNIVTNRADWEQNFPKLMNLYRTISKVCNVG